MKINSSYFFGVAVGVFSFNTSMEISSVFVDGDAFLEKSDMRLFALERAVKDLHKRFAVTVVFSKSLYLYCGGEAGVCNLFGDEVWVKCASRKFSVFDLLLRLSNDDPDGVILTNCDLDFYKGSLPWDRGRVLSFDLRDGEIIEGNLLLKIDVNSDCGFI